MFESVPGQAQAKAFFSRALRDGTLSHAYLLAGPEGLAKTAFARELGAVLVSGCGDCGSCPECERARRGVHPDLHVLEREGDVWRIEQVEADRRATSASSRSRPRIACGSSPRSST